jgi:hypothetical protein
VSATTRSSVSAADRAADLVIRAAAFARRRVVELIIVAMALTIRGSMLASYTPRVGFDADDHFVYIRWFANHWALADPMLSRVSYHPPLYYVIAGAFSRLIHGDVRLFGLPSVVFSSATVLVIWAGLERHLPGRRAARIVGLALAAVLPAAVHLAGMASGEALNGLLATAALLLAAEVLRARAGGRSVVVRAALVGLLLGLEMLTKISALAIVITVAAAVGLELLFGKGERRDRLRRGAPWLAAVAVFAGTCGWYFARNHHLYGHAVLTGLDGPDGKAELPPIDPSYFNRRPLRYFYGASSDVLAYPYYPSGVRPASYFWPLVVTSTFVDYYSFGFVPAPRPSSKTITMIANDYPLPRSSLPFAQASAAGGVVIAASTSVAWFWAVIVCWRRRATGRLLMLMAPAAAIGGLAHFVVKIPFDFNGAIKGAYLQFAAAPLFALFGLAVDQMLRRRATWPVAAVQGAAFAAVTGYTIYARFLTS